MNVRKMFAVSIENFQMILRIPIFLHKFVYLLILSFCIWCFYVSWIWIGISVLCGLWVTYLYNQGWNGAAQKSAWTKGWILVNGTSRIVGRILPASYPEILFTLRRLQDLYQEELPFVLSEGLARNQTESLVEIHQGKKTFLFRKWCIKFGQFTLWFLEQQDMSTVLYAVQKILREYPCPTLVSGRSGDILFVNSALIRWLGHTSASLIGQDFLALIKEPFTSANFSYSQEYAFRTSQGTWSLAKISHVLPFPDHNIWAFFLLPSDFLHSLMAVGNWSLLDSLPIPAAMLDEQGNLQHNNALFKEIFGTYGVPPIPLAQWIKAKDHSLFTKQLRRLRKNSVAEKTTVLEFINANATRAAVFLKYFPSNPHMHGQFLATFHPEAPEFMGHPGGEASKMQLLGQLANGIIHDFNNMLTGIMGFCDLLLQRHSPQESSFKDIEQIKHSSVRAMRLVQQLLAFSKATPPTFVPIDLVLCLQDLTPLITRMIGPKILLTIQKPASLRPICGDKNQLEQLFLNLAINARDAIATKIQHTARNSEDTLTFQIRTLVAKNKLTVVKGFLPPKRYIVVDIIDTGQGIAPENLPHIFDAFFSTKDPGQGTGLGLSNAHQIMQQVQGGITLETEVGKGTMISLFFPEYKGNVPSHATAMSEMRVIEKISTTAILLVEDEDPIRLFASRALREQGHDVVEARDGTQAMRFLKNNGGVIQVVVTDVMMPGMDGPSLATQIRALNPKIKILFVSGYPEEEIRAMLPSVLSDAHFLQKPFSLQELLVSIQKICAE